MSQTIYTIGHSNLDIAEFMEHLGRHHITALADVRSNPTSRFQQFSRESLQATLRQAGVAYVFLGAELGARPRDPSCRNEHGVVDLKLLGRSRAFKQGIDRIISGSKEHRIALMCAERDPITCHRGLLIARELTAQGIEVLHIGARGDLETQHEAKARLLSELDMQSMGLFSTESQVEEEAFRKRGQEVLGDT